MPIAMSYGMGYDEFWSGDIKRVFYFLDACKEKDERELNRSNFIAYLTGIYVQEALLTVAPVLVSNPKKNARTLPYPEKPIELSINKPKVTPAQEQQRQSYIAYCNMKLLEVTERVKQKKLKEMEATDNE